MAVGDLPGMEKLKCYHLEHEAPFSVISATEAGMALRSVGDVVEQENRPLHHQMSWLSWE